MFCLLLAVTLLQVAFYPIVLCLLIASKASGIVKQTLVQTLVDDPEELVATNARLARFSSITAALGVRRGGGAVRLGRAGMVAAGRRSAVRVRRRRRAVGPASFDCSDHAR